MKIKILLKFITYLKSKKKFYLIPIILILNFRYLILVVLILLILFFSIYKNKNYLKNSDYYKKNNYSYFSKIN